MRKTLLAVAVALFAFSAAAQPLTDADRAKLLSHLETTSNNFQMAVEGLSEAQWNFRAAEGRWTIAQVAEHIAAAESLIRSGAEAAMKEPATAEMLKDARKDEIIITMVPDRSKKFQAPEPLVPTGRFKTPAETMTAFIQERSLTMRLASEGGDLRSFAAKNPVLGNVDAYGYLLFLSAHSERHTKQIEEVKADPNFPKE